MFDITMNKVQLMLSVLGGAVLGALGKLDIKYPAKLKEVLEQLEDKNEYSKDTQSDN